MRDKIIQQVVEKFQKRSDVGYEKYGVTLHEDVNHVDVWLTHLQEELMDAVNYIEKLKTCLTEDFQEQLLKQYNEKEK